MKRLSRTNAKCFLINQEQSNLIGLKRSSNSGVETQFQRWRECSDFCMCGFHRRTVSLVILTLELYLYYFFLEKTPEFEPCLAFVKLDIYKYVLLTFLYHPYRFQYSQKNCFRNRFSLPNRIQGFVA